MSKEEDTELRYLEQIRNLLVLQMLKGTDINNTDIARILKVTPQRISQIFAKTKTKKRTKRKK